MWNRQADIILLLSLLASQFVGVGTIDPLAVMTVLFLIAWFLNVFTDTKFLIPGTPLFPAILGLVFFILLSGVEMRFTRFLINFTTTVAKLLLFFLIINAVRTKEQLKKAVVFFIVASLMDALIGIAQLLIWWQTGIVLTLTSPNFRFAGTPWGRLLRASGFARTAQQFCYSLIVAAPLAIFLAFRPEVYSRRSRIFFGIAAVPIAVAIVLSASLGACLAMALGMLVFIYRVRPQRWLQITAVLTVLGGIALATGLVGSTLKTVEALRADSADIRTGLIKLGVQAMREHPITGAGIGEFAREYGGISDYPVHNAILQTGSEIGIPGGLIFLTVFLMIPIRLFLAWWSATSPEEKTLTEAMLIGLIPQLLLMQSEPAAFSQAVWIYFALCEATALIYRQKVRGHRESPRGLAARQAPWPERLTGAEA
jgi:O-antigen ligase